MKSFIVAILAIVLLGSAHHAKAASPPGTVVDALERLSLDLRTRRVDEAQRKDAHGRLARGERWGAVYRSYVDRWLNRVGTASNCARRRSAR